MTFKIPRAAVLTTLVSMLLASGVAFAAVPVRLIFDTDMTGDVDDVGAAAIMHALADNGEVEIIGAIVSDKNPDAVACLDSVNHFFGRPNIPLGQIGAAYFAPNRPSAYAAQVAAAYAHDIGGAQPLQDAVVLYRKLLAQQPDASVTIVTLGYASSLNALLGSPGDNYSSLTGNQLVARKVKSWVAMGGRFQPDGTYKDTRTDVYGNWKTDPAAIKNAVNTWPSSVPIIFSAGGEKNSTGAATFAWDYATGANLCAGPNAPAGCVPAVNANHLVRFAYNTFFNNSGWAAGPTHHSADIIALFVAVRGIEPTFARTDVGHNHMFDDPSQALTTDGQHEWRTVTDSDHPVADLNHIYIRPSMSATTVANQFNALMVQSPGFAALANTTGIRGAYFNGTAFNSPVTTRRDTQINFDWLTGSPAAGVNSDSFSVRWEGAVVPAHSSGTQSYTFFTTSNDGVRLWVNDQLLIDNWVAGPERINSGVISLAAGQHYALKMEFFENTNNAKAALRWSTGGVAEQVIPQAKLRFVHTPRGLTGEYFNNADLTAPALKRTDGQVNFDWTTGSPDPSVGADSFSVRWTGAVIPVHASGTQSYTFFVTSNDGVRLWINDQLLIDDWVAGPERVHSAAVSLAAGQAYPIRMEFFENTNNAKAGLRWSTSGVAEQTIPQAQLRSRHTPYTTN